MKALLVYLRRYRLECVLAPAFKLLEALADLSVPLVVSDILKRGVEAGDRSVIWADFLLLVFLAVAGVGFSFTAQWFAAKASVGFATNLRQAMFDRIQGLSYTELDRLGTDTLITRMTSDINQVQNGVNLALRLLLRSPFIVFGAMIVAFTIDVPTAWIFAGVIPLLLLVVFGVMLTSIPLNAKVQQALDKLLGRTRENLEGVRVIRAFTREEAEIAAFDAQNEALTKMNEKVGRLSAVMNPATYVLINIATILLIRSGALRVQAGSLEQHQVVALYNLMAQIIVELIKLASLIITINRSLACAGRVRDMLAAESSMQYPEKADAFVPAGPDSPVPAVRFDRVSFTYAGAGAESLTDISFTAERGQTVGVIGGTGSGKTTLVDLIARFYDATEGRVEAFGADVRSYPAGELIRQIGVVPQKAVLFEGTVRGNLCWGREEASDEELWEALRLAQAEEVVAGKGGLDAPVEQGGRNFSGGQRQRLTVARALVRRPKILILDDSASALDFATDLKLRRALRKLDKETTVFLVSQRMATVRAADRILVLEDGRLAGSGTHEELLADCPAYQEICASQLPEKYGNTAAAGEAGV
ncbi:MAG: ABC transporter ATP-binding protein [Lachnospiraceae bacterium]|nr:ABC transporter ATP-binding protein [Lachnospiraceae bacterium]